MPAEAPHKSCRILPCQGSLVSGKEVLDRFRRGNLPFLPVASDTLLTRCKKAPRGCAVLCGGWQLIVKAFKEAAVPAETNKRVARRLLDELVNARRTAILEQLAAGKSATSRP